jgi:Tol biopolymer transport system component
LPVHYKLFAAPLRPGYRARVLTASAMLNHPRADSGETFLPAVGACPKIPWESPHAIFRHTLSPIAPHIGSRPATEMEGYLPNTRPRRTCNTPRLFPDAPTPRRVCRALSVVAAISLTASSLAILDCAAAAASEPPTLVSTSPSSHPGASGNRESSAPTVSDDGRYVVFLSAATDLTAALPGEGPNVYLRDRELGVTTLVSANPDGHAADLCCSAPALSAGGRAVVFLSRARNLVAAGGNGWDQVFVRDLDLDVTQLISANTNGAPGAGPCLEARITPNGRFVVFTSAAPDLVPQDGNRSLDVFAHDRVEGTTRLVSVNLDGNASGTGASLHPAVTPDGRFVAFSSTAANLVPNDANTWTDVFVHDLENRVTALVSVDPNGSAAGSDGECLISDDGRWVVFATLSNGIVADDFDRRPDLFRRDLLNRTTTLITTSSLFNTPGNQVGVFAMSSDGHQVVLQGADDVFSPAQPGSQAQLHSWNAESGTTTLITVAFGTSSPASGFSQSPSLSADGRYLTFLSNATNLTADPQPPIHQVYQHDLQERTTRLVSTRPDGVASQQDCSAAGSNRSGRYILFASPDDPLAPDDANQALDVFLRDLTTPTCELISQRNPANPASSTPDGHSLLAHSALSADSRFVAFTTTADHLVPGDTNGFTDVFVRDLLTGQYIWASRNTNGTAANGHSGPAVLSADGRFVAFLSRATDLTSNVTDHAAQLYLHDLQRDTTVLVTTTLTGTGIDASAEQPSISADGRFVVYQSRAANLVPIDNNHAMDVFVYDRLAQTNRLVSMNWEGTNSGLNASHSPLLAPDGRSLVFLSRANDLVSGLAVMGPGPAVFLHDLVKQTTVRISDGFIALLPLSAHRPHTITPDGRFIAFSLGPQLAVYDALTATRIAGPRPGENPFISANGRWVAFERTEPGSTPPGRRQLWVWDTLLNIEHMTTLNHTRTAPANGRSHSPVLSANGRFLTFVSWASDLVPDDTNETADVFVRDLLLGHTWRATRSTPGDGANAASGALQLGADLRTVLFQSTASNLTPHDRNQSTDLFWIRFALPDSDGDGIDDDWELTFFNTLSRDGTGDFDRDGMTDLEEFLAGTDPTNEFSILRAWIASDLPNGNPVVSWTAVPGRSYQVESLNLETGSPWSGLAPTITASSSTAQFTDPSTLDPHRLYRVRLVAPSPGEALP